MSFFKIFMWFHLQEVDRHEERGCVIMQSPRSAFRRMMSLKMLGHCFKACCYNPNDIHEDRRRIIFWALLSWGHCNMACEKTDATLFNEQNRVDQPKVTAGHQMNIIFLILLLISLLVWKKGDTRIEDICSGSVSASGYRYTCCFPLRLSPLCSLSNGIGSLIQSLQTGNWTVWSVEWSRKNYEK